MTIGVLLRPNEAKTNKNVPINSLKKFDNVSLIAGPVQNTASFSRALTQDLSVNQSDADFDAKLKEAVDSIYEASVVKN